MLNGRINFYPAAILGCLLVLVYVFAGPQLIDLLHGTAVTVKHVEAVSISTYGRFHGHALVTDPYSGEFPTFYNFLSDWLINLLALISGLPAFWSQAVIFVPLLIVLLFLGSYWSVRAVGAERKVALLASVLVSASAETPFVHFLYPLLERWSGVSAAVGNLIPPAAGLGGATSQILGWTLFLPVVAALYAARRPDVGDTAVAVRAFFAGALLGVACLVHTLTFLHLGTICSLYLAVETIVSRARERRFLDATVRFVAVVGVTLFIARLSGGNGLSMANFVIFWSACFAISVRDFRSLIFVLFYGLGTIVVASPFLYQIWELSLSANRFDSFDSPVPKVEFTLFYLAYILCGLIVLLNARRLDRSNILIWLAVMIVASLGLGYGKIFGFQNHEYRFLTNLIIPLSVLAAFVVSLPSSTGQKIGLYLLIPLLLVGVVRNLWATMMPLPEVIERSVGPFVSYSGVIALPTGASALLDRVRAETVSSPLSRILLPPEYSYPQQAYRNGLVLAVSQVPAFIADPRFIVWGDLYADRVAVFCSLFPSYPQFDAHTGLHLCEQTPSDLVPGNLALATPSAGTDVLSLYRIELMALLHGDHDRYLADRARQLGMTLVHSADGGMLWRRLPVVDSDRLAFGAASYQESSMLIPVTAPAAGTYVIVLAGRNIPTRVRQIRLAGSAVTSHAIGEDALVVQIDLPAGQGQLNLDLTPDRRFRIVFPTPIRQIIGIKKDAIQKYLTGPAVASLGE